MGYIHIILAWTLKAILFPFLFIINLIVAMVKREASGYLHDMALALDCYGNYAFEYTFNGAFLKKESVYKYGERLETISKVTAKNYYANTLTLFGRFFAKILILFKDKAFTKEENK